MLIFLFEQQIEADGNVQQIIIIYIGPEPWAIKSVPLYNSTKTLILPGRFSYFCTITDTNDTHQLLTIHLINVGFALLSVLWAKHVSKFESGFKCILSAL